MNLSRWNKATVGVERQSRSYAKGPSPEDLPFSYGQGASVNDDIHDALRRIKSQARSIFQRSPTARKIVRASAAMAVGKGCMLRIKNTPDGLAALIEERWKEWGEVGNCTIDQRHSWLQLQYLDIQAQYIDGEYILISREEGPHGFRLETMDAGRLDVEYNRSRSDRRKVVMGIEFDRREAATAYWFQRKPRATRQYVLGSFTPKEPPFRVRGERVLHLFDRDFVDQYRGVPILATAMQGISNIHKYAHLEIQAASNAAAATPYITSGDNVIDQSDNYDQDTQPVEFSGESISQLPRGYGIESFSPEHPTMSFPEFLKAQTQNVSAAMDVPYSQTSGDYGAANFSSERSAMLTQRDVVVRFQELLVRQSEWTFSKWLERAVLSGVLPMEAIRAEYEFVPRTFAHIQPREQAAADQLAVANGFKSRGMVIREGGHDPEDVFRELEEEHERLSKIGIGEPPVQQDTQSETEDAVANALENSRLRIVA